MPYWNEFDKKHALFASTILRAISLAGLAGLALISAGVIRDIVVTRSIQSSREDMLVVGGLAGMFGLIWLVTNRHLTKSK